MTILSPIGIPHFSSPLRQSLKSYDHYCKMANVSLVYSIQVLICQLQVFYCQEFVIWHLEKLICQTWQLPFNC